jgi:prepilin-type N-terminal cleavage/methylation domain-containing protein
MKTKQAGFTLIEVLVVVLIIMILAAISVPAMSEYLRNYRIRGATQQVAGGISETRTKAIMRNVNRGTLFLIMPDRQNPAIYTQYQWVVPEQSLAAGAPGYQDLDVLVADPAQAGTLRSLPPGIRFVQGGNANMLGFNRLGGICDPATTCGIPPVGIAGVPLCPDCINVNALTAVSTVTLLQERDNQQRTVTVLAGGRVLAQP